MLNQKMTTLLKGKLPFTLKIPPPQTVTFSKLFFAIFPNNNFQFYNFNSAIINHLPSMVLHLLITHK